MIYELEISPNPTVFLKPCESVTIQNIQVQMPAKTKQQMQIEHTDNRWQHLTTEPLFTWILGDQIMKSCLCSTN